MNPFVKQIYFANIEKVEEKANYKETGGPVFFESDLVSALHKPQFSFIMKDKVVPVAIAKITELKLI
ncbi:hypothetical protein ACI2OX_06805 [Bacillus sp. N9]